MANKGRNPQNDEISLWVRMTQGIKSWHRDNHAPYEDTKSVENCQKPSSPPSVMDIPVNTTNEIAPLQGANGLDKRTSQKLAKGKMPIEARIDLHGLTQDQARHQLTVFIQNAFKAQKRCVLVVTGKGSRAVDDTGLVSERRERGILRVRLTEWLYSGALAPIVLSHAQATPRDGGSGAFYIYLKNHRKY